MALHRHCKYCGRPFGIRASALKRRPAAFCTLTCYRKAWHEFLVTYEHRPAPPFPSSS